MTTPTRPHACHWPGCQVEVLPRFWGCLKHWNALPIVHRKAISRAYRPGQELDKRPSAEYRAAAAAADAWIRSR